MPGRKPPNQRGDFPSCLGHSERTITRASVSIPLGGAAARVTTAIPPHTHLLALHWLMLPHGLIASAIWDGAIGCAGTSEHWQWGGLDRPGMDTQTGGRHAVLGYLVNI